MLVQKLNVADLQFAKMTPFDGTMAYAQNKRQQVIMTEKYATQFPAIHFSSMHPGWADTPGKSKVRDYSVLYRGGLGLVQMRLGCGTNWERGTVQVWCE